MSLHFFSELISVVIHGFYSINMFLALKACFFYQDIFNLWFEQVGLLQLNHTYILFAANISEDLKMSDLCWGSKQPACIIIICWVAVGIHLTYATEFKVIIWTGWYTDTQRDTYCSQLHLIGLHNLVYSRRRTETLCNSHSRRWNQWWQGIPWDSVQLKPTGHLNCYCN